MKVRFGVIGVAVTAALLTSCTQAEGDPDWSHRRPEPDAPATGPIVAEPAIGDTWRVWTLPSPWSTGVRPAAEAGDGSGRAVEGSRRPRRWSR